MRVCSAASIELGWNFDSIQRSSKVFGFDSTDVVRNNSTYMLQYLSVELQGSQELLSWIICSTFLQRYSGSYSSLCHSSSCSSGWKLLTWEEVSTNFWKLGQSTNSLVNISWCEFLWESWKKKQNSFELERRSRESERIIYLKIFEKIAWTKFWTFCLLVYRVFSFFFALFKQKKKDKKQIRKIKRRETVKKDHQKESRSADTFFT